MIKNILLPEKLGSYYLFAKRIIGFELTKYHVFATVVYLRGSEINIEKCLTMTIEQDNGEDQSTRTAKAIKKILQTVDGYSAIYVGLSSTQIIFKTMKLPFDDPEKIKRVIEFEVEPLLPFAITDAVVDFIITEKHTQEKSAEVLVAAVQKQYIRQTSELFGLAGVQPELLTIDLFALYGLYTMIPDYAQLQGGVTLLEIDSSITKIAYLLDGQLKFIRTVPFGLSQLIKSISSDLPLNQRDVMDDLLQYGFKREEDPAYMQALNKAAQEFATKISFTLQSFVLQTEQEQAITHMLLSGVGAMVKDFDQWLTQNMGFACTLFDAGKITQQPHLHLKNLGLIPVENSISTAIALPCPLLSHFNLRQKEFAVTNEQLLLKQLLMAGVMLLLIFAGLFTHNFMQLRKLQSELKASSREASLTLQEWFPSIDSGHIDNMIGDATNEAKKEEKLWFSFGQTARNSMLSLLLELTRLDRQGLGLIVDKVVIDQDRGILLFKAQVKDYEALRQLENELRQSKVFTFVPPQENTNFTMELRFATGPEGAS